MKMKYDAGRKSIHFIRFCCVRKSTKPGESEVEFPSGEQVNVGLGITSTYYNQIFLPLNITPDSEDQLKIYSK